MQKALERKSIKDVHYGFQSSFTERNRKFYAIGIQHTRILNQIHYVLNDYLPEESMVLYSGFPHLFTGFRR